MYCSALFTKFLQAQLKILFFIKPYLTRQADMLGSFTGLLNLEPFSILCLCPCLAFSTPHVSVPCQWAYPATVSQMGSFLMTEVPSHCLPLHLSSLYLLSAPFAPLLYPVSQRLEFHKLHSPNLPAWCGSLPVALFLLKLYQ